MQAACRLLRLYMLWNSACGCGWKETRERQPLLQWVLDKRFRGCVPIEGKVVKVGKTKKSLKCYHPECNEKRKESATGDKGGKGGIGSKATFANAKQTLGGMGDIFNKLG